MTRLGVAAALLFASCSVSPVPDPPNLDLDKMTVDIAGSVPVIVGAPGAAEPLGEAWGVDLEGTSPPITARVAADGSFRLGPIGRPSGEVRIQVRTATDRSEPIDATLVAGALFEVARPLDDCLSLTPRLEIPLSPSTTIRVQNGCAADVTIGTLRLRAPVSTITIDTPAPLAVPIGESRDVQITFSPTDMSAVEEILFLDVTAPSMERLPVTLFRAGVP